MVCIPPFETKEGSLLCSTIDGKEDFLINETKGVCCFWQFFANSFFPSSFLLSKKSSIEKTIDFFTTTIFSFLLYPKFHLVKIVVIVVEHSVLILEKWSF